MKRLIACLLLVCGQAHAATKPSFIIIFPDDQCYGDLGAFGSPKTSQILLFNLAADLGKKNNLAAQNPEIVGRLRQKMLEQDAAIEAGARPVWKKPKAKPQKRDTGVVLCRS